ncbi:MAG: hypothetical protein L7U47_09595 [Alphaproteobacteria bacterium]|nr:hypothetical protein [Alphaproteobacteria bacterium]
MTSLPNLNIAIPTALVFATILLGCATNMPAKETKFDCGEARSELAEKRKYLEQAKKDEKEQEKKAAEASAGKIGSTIAWALVGGDPTTFTAAQMNTSGDVTKSEIIDLILEIRSKCSSSP